LAVNPHWEVPVRRSCTAIALFAILVLGVVPAVASARDVNVTYTVREAGLAPVPDRGKKAPDFLVGNSPLFDRRNRRQVGQAPIVCTFRAKSSTPRCIATLYLRRGSINLEGDLKQPRFTFRVTGGQGIYANVTGTSSGTVLNPKERDPLRVRVRLTLRLQGVR